MKRKMPALALALPLAVGAACDHEPTTEVVVPVCEPAPVDTLVTLIDHAAWELAPVASDPFVAFRPEDVACPETSRKHEDFAGIDSFGVETAACGYTTVMQPLKTAICDGEQLYVWIWRFALTGPEGATSNIAVQIGDELAWSIEVPIPATSALVALPVPLSRGYEAGTPIYFHVRNHGDNAYQLLDLARCAGECAPE